MLQFSNISQFALITDKVYDKHLSPLPTDIYLLPKPATISNTYPPHRQTFIP